MPLIRKCGCLPLKTGCLLVCVLSTPQRSSRAEVLGNAAQSFESSPSAHLSTSTHVLACIADIVAGAWNLPSHRERDPEDNLVSLSMIMFSSLSAVSNAIALVGIFLKRPGYLHFSLTSNCVFIICIFVVAVVTCAFRMEGFVTEPLYVLLIVLLLCAGAAYSVLYLMVVNSYYRTMKMDYGESTIPI